MLIFAGTKSPPKIAKKGCFVTGLLPATCKSGLFYFIINQLQKLLCFANEKDQSFRSSIATI
jgi:hypothetical protein